jgi:hypothetical protein
VFDGHLFIYSLWNHAFRITGFLGQSLFMEPSIQNYRLPWAIILYGTKHSELQASLGNHSLWNHAYSTGFLGQSPNKPSLMLGT